MTDQELCTQYELIAAMLKSGNTEEVIKILDDAIKRIKGVKDAPKDDKNDKQ